MSASLHIKRGSPREIAHEREVMRYVRHYAARHGLRLCPQSFGPHDAQQLRLEALEGPTLHSEFHDTAPSGGEESARSLGELLADIHQVPAGGLPAARDPFPVLTLRPLDLRIAIGETPQLLGYLSRDERAHKACTNLRNQITPATLIHGDAKLDNFMYASDKTLLAIDWECAGQGDPSWDLGSVVGDYYSRHLLSIDVQRDKPLKTWLQDARISSNYSLALAREMLAVYAQMAQPIDVRRVAAFAGIFLMHRAQAWVERYGEFSSKALLLAHFGVRFLVKPGVLASLLDESY